MTISRYKGDIIGPKGLKLPEFIKTLAHQLGLKAILYIESGGVYTKFVVTGGQEGIKAFISNIQRMREYIQ